MICFHYHIPPWIQKWQCRHPVPKVRYNSQGPSREPTVIRKSHNFLSAALDQNILGLINSASEILPDEQAIINKQPHDSQEGITHVRDIIFVPSRPARVAILPTMPQFSPSRTLEVLRDPTTNYLLLLVVPDESANTVVRCLL